MLRRTDAAREQVQGIADDRTTDALTVVSAAADAYREVEHHARRLSGTTVVSRASAALNPAAPGSRQPHWTAPPTPRPPDNHLSETINGVGESLGRGLGGAQPVPVELARRTQHRSAPVTDGTPADSSRLSLGERSVLFGQ
jgi:hypothetical protein